MFRPLHFHLPRSGKGVVRPPWSVARPPDETNARLNCQHSAQAISYAHLPSSDTRANRAPTYRRWLRPAGNLACRHAT